MSDAALPFAEYQQASPCAGCPAPCCRMQVNAQPVPTTFMDLDRIRYILLFPENEICISRNGDWSVVRWQTCSALNAATSLCQLHGTPAKPRTCVLFNEHGCWYKKNFVLEESPDVYRLDLARFDVWIREVSFAQDSTIVDGPNFEEGMELVADIPMARRFEPMTLEQLKADPRFGQAMG